MSSRAIFWTVATVATVAGLAPLAHLASGCTSSAAPAAVPDAEATCPASVSDAVGAACAAEGLVCSPEYACGILPAIASCTCTSGAFDCTDITGKSLAVGDQPGCPTPAVAEVCPATEVLANQHVCTDVTLQCPYPSTCSGSQDYDVCQCSSLLDGGTGRQFVCPTPCDYDAAPNATKDAMSADVESADASRDAGHAEPLD